MPSCCGNSTFWADIIIETNVSRHLYDVQTACAFWDYESHTLFTNQLIIHVNAHRCRSALLPRHLHGFVDDIARFVGLAINGAFAIDIVGDHAHIERYRCRLESPREFAPRAKPACCPKAVRSPLIEGVCGLLRRIVSRLWQRRQVAEGSMGVSEGCGPRLTTEIDRIAAFEIVARFGILAANVTGGNFVVILFGDLSQTQAVAHGDLARLLQAELRKVIHPNRLRPARNRSGDFASDTHRFARRRLAAKHGSAGLFRIEDFARHAKCQAFAFSTSLRRCSGFCPCNWRLSLLRANPESTNYTRP